MRLFLCVIIIMETITTQRERKRQQGIVWFLWSLSIVLTLILIWVQNADGNSSVAVSHHIVQGEHIPGNISEGSREIASSTEPDDIQQENSASEGEGAEEITQIPESEDAEEITQIPEGEDAEEITQIPEGENAEEITQTPEGEGAEEITQAPEDEDTEEITQVPESEGTEDGKEERVIDPDKPMVALTFDDGPYRNNTKAIMEIFEQYDARATFFVVGYHLDAYTEETLEAYRRGFQIGNHTMNHPKLPNISDEEAMEEIRLLNDRLNELGIEGEAMVRTPYGLPTDYLRENLTVPMIGWNVDSEDWLVGDADRIYEQIVGKVKDGDIVLLHDLQDVTAEAMQKVVPALVAEGFQLVTVEEMFAAKGIEPQAGEYYCYVR